MTANAQGAQEVSNEDWEGMPEPQKKRGRPRKTDPRNAVLVPIEQIDEDRSEPLQFRNGLSDDTLRSMRRALPPHSQGYPVTLVACVLGEDEETGEERLYPVEEGDAEEDVRYLLADGWHRFQVVQERTAGWTGDDDDEDEEGVEPTFQEEDDERIWAVVLRPARDPWKAAQEIAIRANIKGQTQVTPGERAKAALIYHALHPGWSLRKIQEEVGLSHTHIRRLIISQEVRQALQPNIAPHMLANREKHVLALHAAPREAWSDVAAAMIQDEWTADALEEAITRVREGTWPPGWDDLSAAERIRLAYEERQQDWTWDQLTRAVAILNTEGVDLYQRQRVLHGELPDYLWGLEPEPQTKPQVIPEPATSLEAKAAPEVQPKPVTSPEAKPEAQVERTLQTGGEPEAAVVRPKATAQDAILARLDAEEQRVAKVMAEWRYFFENISRELRRLEDKRADFIAHASLDEEEPLSIVTNSLGGLLGDMRARRAREGIS